MENGQPNNAPVTTSPESGPPANTQDDRGYKPENRGCKPLLQGDSGEQGTAGTRRDFLGRSARRLAYIAPVVLLLRPRPACASRIYS